MKSVQLCIVNHIINVIHSALSTLSESECTHSGRRCDIRCVFDSIYIFV